MRALAEGSAKQPLEWSYAHCSLLPASTLVSPIRMTLSVCFLAVFGHLCDTTVCLPCLARGILASARAGCTLRPTMALAICENKVTFSERSYAHCSMSIYMHPRLRRYGVELDLRHVAESLPWCMLPEKWHDWSCCFALWEGIERSTRCWVNRRSLAALLNR